MTAILIDTNVLVYAFDRHAFTKQLQAMTILATLQSGREGFLSVQNVGADLEGVRFVNPFAPDFALAAWA